MTAEKMWELSGLSGEYDAWCFGGDPNGLAQLVKDGIKTATAHMSTGKKCMSHFSRKN